MLACCFANGDLCSPPAFASLMEEIVLKDFCVVPISEKKKEILISEQPNLDFQESHQIMSCLRYLAKVNCRFHAKIWLATSKITKRAEAWNSSMYGTEAGGWTQVQHQPGLQNSKSSWSKTKGSTPRLPSGHPLPTLETIVVECIHCNCFCFCFLTKFL